MLKKLLPVVLALIGLAGGLAAGAFLKPAPAPEEPAASETAETKTAPAEHPAPAETAAEADPLAHDSPADPEAKWEYAKLDNQFVVPVMGDGRVASMVVLSISLEITPGHGNDVFAREPKLRDSFLRVLFAHERAGGFSGVFTDQRVMGELRGRLREAARAVLGKIVNDVLVTDILRQDV